MSANAKNAGTKLTPPSPFTSPSEKLKEPVTSENLLQSACLRLYDLMNQITEREINPQNVSTACECAGEIYKLLKLNLEIKKHFG